MVCVCVGGGVFDNISLAFFYERATMEKSHCEHRHICQCFVNSGGGREGAPALLKAVLGSNWQGAHARMHRTTHIHTHTLTHSRVV